MKLTVVLNMVNAAFGESPESRTEEAYRILEKYAASYLVAQLTQQDGLGSDRSECPLHDFNGNMVGSATVETGSDGDA